ncbi:hypothetical protein DMH15_19885 [Streptomyces sp. WAC 06725]|uniref:hypothetical protein n=1 Tax=Streptomyces sp. WAC 06725 TaxID=2203209 RepID=UPI000F747DAE|nr:hypothetical protein [Streptomyces sp. WAC 06725]RSO35465.1 hypothetical protein DMH15_19885 [Streptomyces sp. WAC 06725]
MAWVAAVVLVLEALAILFLNYVLSVVVDRQHMSMAGMDPAAMSAGAWVLGAVFALYLVCCAVLLTRIAVRDRPPGTFGRIVLITCAVVHAVLGAFAVGLAGWTAFALLMVVLALLVLTLTAYGTAYEPGGNPRPATAPTHPTN